MILLLLSEADQSRFSAFDLCGRTLIIPAEKRVTEVGVIEGYPSMVGITLRRVRRGTSEKRAVGKGLEWTFLPTAVPKTAPRWLRERSFARTAILRFPLTLERL